MADSVPSTTSTSVSTQASPEPSPVTVFFSEDPTTVSQGPKFPTQDLTSSLVLLNVANEALERLKALDDPKVDAFLDTALPFLAERTFNIRSGLNQLSPMAIMIQRYTNLRQKLVSVKTAVHSACTIANLQRPVSVFHCLGTEWLCMVTFVDHQHRFHNAQARSSNKSNAEASAFTALMHDLGALFEDQAPDTNLTLEEFQPIITDYLSRLDSVPDSYVIKKYLRQCGHVFTNDVLQKALTAYRRQARRITA
jgi:hypothetical protein